MDCNGKDAKTKPLISSFKRQREERVLYKEEENDESERLLPPSNGEISSKGKGAPKTRRKVQWNDINGDKLAEVVEFQPSDASDSDDDDSDSCFCTIM